MSVRLAVPLLRPPEHRADILVTPQTHWLNSATERTLGWRAADLQQAQTLANQGRYVLGTVWLPATPACA
ncbi:conserved hypothetical protein [Thiomonas sp. CB3]|nr:conserved hypothetical protein [Thiomonas sp. CB3]